MSASQPDPNSTVTHAELQALLKDLTNKVSTLATETEMLKQRVAKLETTISSDIQAIKKSAHENYSSLRDSYGMLCTNANLDRDQVDIKLGNLSRDIDGKLRDQEFALRRYCQELVQPPKSEDGGSNKDEQEQEAAEPEAEEPTEEAQEQEEEATEEPEEEVPEPEEIKNPSYVPDLVVEIELPI